MANLKTLADRVHHAIHCLPRDPRTGEPPSVRSIEAGVGLANATIKRVVDGDHVSPRHQTMLLMAKALKVPVTWLYDGGDDDAPTPTGPVTPRLVRGEDGEVRWATHGEIPGWSEAVAEAQRTRTLPFGAYRAGAAMPLLRSVSEATANIAYGISLYAWEIATRAERAMYGTDEARAELDKRPSATIRASRIGSRSKT